MMVPFLSIVMPVRNEERFIRDTLMQLLEQDYPAERYEIMVVDGISDDGTRNIVTVLAKQYPQIRLLDNPARISSSGRNVGFRNGKGDYFLVIDGHCFIPTNKLFRNVIECFEKYGTDCLGRPQPLDPPGLTTFQKAVALARNSRLGHGGDSLIYGDYEGFASPVSNGAAYRREVFGKVGYVDETFDAAEDLEFNFRVEKALLRSYTSPLLTVRYYPRENMKGLFCQMLRYGIGRYRFIRKHPEALTVNQLIPAGFVLGLLLFAIFCSWFLLSGANDSKFGLSFLFFGLLCVIYFFYVLIVLAESLRIAAGNGRIHYSLLPLIFFIIHFGIGCGFWKSLCRFDSARAAVDCQGGDGTGDNRTNTAPAR